MTTTKETKTSKFFLSIRSAQFRIFFLSLLQWHNTNFCLSIIILLSYTSLTYTEMDIKIDKTEKQAHDILVCIHNSYTSNRKQPVVYIHIHMPVWMYVRVFNAYYILKTYEWKQSVYLFTSVYICVFNNRHIYIFRYCCKLFSPSVCILSYTNSKTLHGAQFADNIRTEWINCVCLLWFFFLNDFWKTFKIRKQKFCFFF